MNTIKQVGMSGQITIGKKYAGKTVQVIEDEKEGKITLLLGSFIPENERWIYKEPYYSELQESLRYIAQNPPQETKLSSLKIKKR